MQYEHVHTTGTQQCFPDSGGGDGGDGGGDDEEAIMITIVTRVCDGGWHPYNGEIQLHYLACMKTPVSTAQVYIASTITLHVLTNLPPHTPTHHTHPPTHHAHYSHTCIDSISS